MFNKIGSFIKKHPRAAVAVVVLDMLGNYAGYQWIKNGAAVENAVFQQCVDLRVQGIMTEQPGLSQDEMMDEASRRRVVPDCRARAQLDRAGFKFLPFFG